MALAAPVEKALGVIEKILLGHLPPVIQANPLRYNGVRSERDAQIQTALKQISNLRNFLIKIEEK